MAALGLAEALLLFYSVYLHNYIILHEICEAPHESSYSQANYNTHTHMHTHTDTHTTFTC